MTEQIPNLYLPAEIMTDDRLTLRQIRVLMAIFSWRKTNTNLARVSRQMISDRTGYPLSRISTITTELESLGWIKKKGNGGKSQWVEYRVRELKNFKKTKKTKQNSNDYQNGNGNQNGNGYQNGNKTVTNSVTQTVTKTVRGIDTGVNTVIVQEEYIGHFDNFWSNYPRKRKKKEAQKIWKTKKLDSKAQTIIADISQRATQDRRWLEGYIPDPTTYLRNERWDDEIEQAKQTTPTKPKDLGYTGIGQLLQKKKLEIQQHGTQQTPGDGVALEINNLKTKLRAM